jgi:hypothetical protein
MLELSPRLPVPRSCGTWALVAAVLATVMCAREAPAAEPFVDAPLTLPPLHFSADAGIGWGTYQQVLAAGTSLQNTAYGSTQVGWGTSLEAAVGLPFVGELGVRIGYRFGPNVVNAVGLSSSASSPAGALANADQFARLFDPISSEPGQDAFANPEIRLRGSLIDLTAVQLGLETRFVVPTANGSFFATTPGIPVRVHVPGFLRVDTGLWLPITFGRDPIDGSLQATYSFQIPVQALFQVNSAFFGPITGIRYNILSPAGLSNTVDIPLGVAAGYTLGGGVDGEGRRSLAVDLKVQLRTDRINDSTWASQSLGGGLGVGLRLP